jgi:flagellar protein FlaJ
MAENKLSSILSRIKLPRFLVPDKVLQQMEVNLVRANISFSALEWMGIFFVASILFFVIGTLLFSIVVGLGLFCVPPVLMVVLPKMQADKRRGQIEEALPDALHHMAVAIRTGLVLESVIQDVAQAEYGALSEEFSRIVVEMRRGRPLKEALLMFAKRTGSKEIERAMRLLLEGVESGGPISEVLEEVSEDIRAVRAIQRERKTATQQQISFLAMASLMAGPFVMGVVASLPSIMAQTTAGIGATAAAFEELNREINVVVTALTFYVVAQACSAALMMGVVMYGDMKKGFKFMLPMGIAAFFVFKLIQFIMPGMVAAF